MLESLSPFKGLFYLVGIFSINVYHAIGRMCISLKPCLDLVFLLDLVDIQSVLFSMSTWMIHCYQNTPYLLLYQLLYQLSKICVTKRKTDIKGKYRDTYVKSFSKVSTHLNCNI